LVLLVALVGCGIGASDPPLDPPLAAPTRAQAPRQAAPVGGDKQVLFGDLHVHTTWSMDAFGLSVPMMGGTGARPPADACTHARWCSGLDFFALTDHAESLTPEHWAAEKAEMRQCAALAGDPADPDLVPFTGFEWTQVGRTADSHFGHRNVIFKDLDEASLPARPIVASGLAREGMKAQGISLGTQVGALIRGLPDLQQYTELLALRQAIANLDPCPDGPVRELPLDCMEGAETPKDLFAKLDEWGFDTMVIPHGTTWGFYTPPGATWEKGLSEEHQDRDRQRLIEVYSGHGSAEEWRPWQHAAPDGDGWTCPAPDGDFEACCWRAGEIIRGRCGDQPEATCEALVAEARADFLELGSAGFRSVPGATVADWGDCGVCEDCFLPALDHRPRSSVQAILAGAAFDGDAPSHADFGLIASSDNHGARPGTGYKEWNRGESTDAGGPVTPGWAGVAYGERGTPEARTQGGEALADIPSPHQIFTERQASFFTTGGLVAVHSDGRDRGAIWDALQRREVYATSGPRILLWFDQVSDDGARSPMGADVVSAAPRFEVRALGAMEQQPGCAAEAAGGPPASVAREVCLDECYRPGDTRVALDRLEVVRIRRQRSSDEDLAELIDDPWRSFDCPAVGACTAAFSDPEPPGPEVLYYVRAVQVPTPTVNAGNLRCEGGDCDPCYGDWRTPADDDCLAPAAHRAWSSPIFVDVAGDAPG
jgi:hypothetical protein